MPLHHAWKALPHCRSDISTHKKEEEKKTEKLFVKYMSLPIKITHTDFDFNLFYGVPQRMQHLHAVTKIERKETGTGLQHHHKILRFLTLFFVIYGILDRSLLEYKISNILFKLSPNISPRRIIFMDLL